MSPSPISVLAINGGSSSVRFASFDRFHLVADVIDRVPALGPRAAYALQAIRERLIEHKQYIAKHGEDMPEIRNWRWGMARTSQRARGGPSASTRDPT